MAYGCYNSADLCGVRISLIADDGTPIFSNPDGSAYNLNPIQLTTSVNVSTGDTFEQRNGCGDVCYTKTNPDTETGEDLTLTLCTYDTEFIALATGGGNIFDGSTEHIGFWKGVEASPLTEFHAWSKSFDGSSRVASPRSWWHHTWPQVTWTLGDRSFGENSLIVTLNGTAVPNGNIGDGGFSDIPETRDAGSWYTASWLADDIPVATEAPYNANGIACGYIDTPADDS